MEAINFNFNRDYAYFVETTSIDMLSKWTRRLALDFKDIKYWVDYTEHDMLRYQLIICSKWDCMPQLRASLNTEVYLYFEHH